MAKKREEINIRSEEIQDLMVKTPSWMVRWGISAIFLIILILLLFTWIMKYPDIIHGPITVTASTPPVKVVNRASGKVIKIFKKNNDFVKAGTIIAEIENPVSTDVVNYLESYITELDDSLYAHSNHLPLPDTGDMNYGDIQIRMNELHRDLKLYGLRKSHDLDEMEVRQLKSRIANHRELIEITDNLLEIEESELKNAKDKYETDKALYEMDALSKYEYLDSEIEYHNQEQEYQQLRLSIVQYQMALNSMEVELANKKYGQEETIQTDMERILSHREFIYNFIKTWKQQYAIVAPVDGSLSYMRPLYTNQFIQENESYFAIIQENEDMIGWVLVPSTGYGKIQSGQRVNVRLDNYPFHEYGMLEGEVIGTSRVPQQNQYQVEVRFPNGLMTSYKRTLDFAPEMSGGAEIVTEKKRLIERIFDSFIKLLNREHHTRG